MQTTVMTALNTVLKAALTAIVLCAGHAGADEPGQDRVRRAPRLYVTGLVGGAFAGADFDGTTPADGDFSGVGDDGSPFGGAAIGTILDLGWSVLRLELEGTGGRRFAIDVPASVNTYEIETDIWTLQGNFWFEYPLVRVWPHVPIVRRLAPFAGGGVGFSRLSVDASGGGASGASETPSFAWQAGAGIAFEASSFLFVEARYQYADLGKPSVDLASGGNSQGRIELDFGTHEVVGGVRVVLPSL
jgi:opacity protein-like surface antigen